MLRGGGFGVGLGGGEQAGLDRYMSNAVERVWGSRGELG